MQTYSCWSYPRPNSKPFHCQNHPQFLQKKPAFPVYNLAIRIPYRLVAWYHYPLNIHADNNNLAYCRFQW